MDRPRLVAVLVGLALPIALAGQTPPQTQADSYTRYELQAPGSAAFRILYDVSATTPGATRYFNTIRAGAEEEVHGVWDRATGAALEWDLVDGAEARRTGHPGASLEGRYIRVHLARPVPDGGEARILIDKTYVDPASYRAEGEEIVFERSLGIRANAVVLPAGYELVGVNHPSQVAREEDGRLRVSFLNDGEGAVDYLVRGRRLPPAGASELLRPSLPAAAHPPEDPPPLVPDPSVRARPGYEAPERAGQSREIVYFLHAPSTGSFSLYHDYTEDRPGVDRYLNVVRAGSRVSNPSAVLLDTGEELPVETVRGRAVADRGILPPDRVDEETEVVVIRFPPVEEGESARLRIRETYTDRGRYLRWGDELLWDRGFGRTRNEVVLPEGWALTGASMPARVSQDPDGRIRLLLWNDRPDGLQVHVRARRREGVVQAESASGEPLRARVATVPSDVLRADSILARHPEDVDALIAAGRVRRDYWLYRDARALYTRAIELGPEDWRAWRYRGHRCISLRCFDQAVADLEEARERAPHAFDVAYHLGLAYYLQGRWQDAADEYGRCLEQARTPLTDPDLPPLGDLRSCADVAVDDDARVALADWRWRALRRAGRDTEAALLLETVTPDMDVEANRAYHRALLVYRGLEDEADVLSDPEYRLETVGYGLAVWHETEGRTERARELLEEIAAHPHWPGFGRIAAETDLARARR
ncbi:MAG: tetratricopeptide repeat protein [Gemmatimonadota bacterium]